MMLPLTLGAAQIARPPVAQGLGMDREYLIKAETDRDNV